MGTKTVFRIGLGDAGPGNLLWLKLQRRFERTLLSGGLVILPTETSYLLGANACDARAVARVRKVKNKPVGQEISVAFGSIRKAMEWAIWDRRAFRLAEAFLPGPLTVVLPLREDRAVLPVCCGDTLGIRIPGLKPLIDILQTLDFPVTATSANRHGDPEPYSIESCVQDADLIWDAGKLDRVSPSTVISLAGDRERILRPGSISEGSIRRVLRGKGPIEKI